MGREGMCKLAGDGSDDDDDDDDEDEGVDDDQGDDQGDGDQDGAAPRRDARGASRAVTPRIPRVAMTRERTRTPQTQTHRDHSPSSETRHVQPSASSDIFSNPHCK